MTECPSRNGRLECPAVFGFPLLMIFLIGWVGTFLGCSSVAGDRYSFVVFGDSRIPAYAPYDKQHRDKLNTLVGRVEGELQGDASPNYEAVFNPATLLLERIELPGDTQKSVRIIKYGSDGWPNVFVDKKGDSSQISLRASGQEWAYDNIVRDVSVPTNCIPSVR